MNLGIFELEILEVSVSMALFLSSKYFVRIALLLAFKSFFVGAFEYLFGPIGLKAACDDVVMKNSPVIMSKDRLKEIFLW